MDGIAMLRRRQQRQQKCNPTTGVSSIAVAAVATKRAAVSLVEHLEEEEPHSDTEDAQLARQKDMDDGTTSTSASLSLAGSRASSKALESPATIIAASPPPPPPTTITTARLPASAEAIQATKQRQARRKHTKAGLYRQPARFLVSYEAGMDGKAHRAVKENLLTHTAERYFNRLRWLQYSAPPEKLSKLRQQIKKDLLESNEQCRRDSGMLAKATELFLCRACSGRFTSRKRFYTHNGAAPEAIAAFGQCAGYDLTRLPMPEEVAAAATAASAK